MARSQRKQKAKNTAPLRSATRPRARAAVAAAPMPVAAPAAVRTLTVEQQQQDFLRHYAAIGVVTAAAKITGIDRQRHYEWLEDPRFPDYPQRFANATHEAAEVMEAAMVHRGVKGWMEPVFQGGQLVGHKPCYSDRMLEIGLKARLPEKYRENKYVEHVGAGGGPIQTKVIDADAMTQEQIEQRMDLIKRSLAAAVRQVATQAVAESVAAIDPVAAYEQALAKRAGGNGNGSS